MQLIGGLLFSWLLVARSASAVHPPSPCPDVFSYEGTEPENNRWYGEIALRTDESLLGVRLDIELDRPADLMVSWMGEITSTDNLKFTILNFEQKLKPGPPVLSRIMAKFDRSTGSPKVRFIRLNGRKICPDDSSSYNTQYEESHRPSKPQSTKRPDPEFGENYGENANENPVNGNVNNNYNNNEHNTDYLSSVGNNRPVYKPSTTTVEDHYTTMRTTTTRDPYNENGNINNRPNNNNNRPSNNNNNNRPSTSNNNNNNVYKPNNNPATVSLQASSTDSNREINGVINEFLHNNENKSNKTVIITVIEQPQQNNRPNQNRPNTSNGGDSNGGVNRPIATNNSGGQSRPNANSNNRPNENLSVPNQRPNSGQGGNSFTSTTNSQQLPSGAATCGDVKMSVPLVTNGQSTHRGQWPWHVALYMIEGINLSYNCGGSLVSKNKVITAAHCVTNKQNDAVVNSSKLVIYLGKYHQLHYSDELGVQTKQVIRINVYPTYNSTTFLGDIAVLTLSSDAEFTKFVTPVCLWDESSNLDDIVGKEGTVVGWGYDENDTPTEELKLAKMPVVSHQTCLWSYPQFYSEFTSNKTFCAGFRNGTSVCNGDSGGGMVFNINSRWYLRGIVSITVAKEGLRVCDTRHYVVFTDVAKYLDFVKKNLR